MRRVLIVCSSFPPQSDVGGLRPAMMAKYLPEFGWEPFVLTRAYGKDHPRKDAMMSLGKLIDEDHLLSVSVSAEEEREFLAGRGFLQHVKHLIALEEVHPPCEFTKMRQAAYSHYDHLGIDVIWATAPDFAPLRIGRGLSAKLRIPWVADFRDLSEQEKGIPRGWRAKFLISRGNLRRRMLVGSAASLTSVSKYHCKVLEAKTRKRCDLIYNGFDPEVFKPVDPVPASRFKIAYVGRLLSEHHQNPRLFFEALDSLLADGRIDDSNLEVSFYGVDRSILEGICGAYRSWKCCRVHDRIPHDTVPRVLSEASILLLITEYRGFGVLTTKLFEYLAMERPILCVRSEPDSAIAKLLHETDAGYAGDQLEQVKAFILRCHEQWRGNGYTSQPVKRDLVDGFSRRTQAGRLAEVLHLTAS